MITHNNNLTASVDRVFRVSDGILADLGGTTIVKKYTEPTSLTPQLLHEFVDKIVVHEADKSSGHRIQRIDVHYNFIGEVDFSPEFRR